MKETTVKSTDVKKPAAKPTVKKQLPGTGVGKPTTPQSPKRK